MMADANANQYPLVSDIAYELVQEIAPRELPLFQITSKAYFEKPDKVFEEFIHHGGILNFGLDSVTIFLTPAVLAVTNKVITFLWNKVKEAIQEESEEIINKFVKDMFKSIPYKKKQGKERQDEKTSLKLSREELVQLHQIMLETAKQLRLPQHETELLVNAMVGRLVTTNT